MTVQTIQKNIVNDAIIKDISDSIHGLSYGTVTITVHNSKIVQIERIEKSRFEDLFLENGDGI